MSSSLITINHSAGQTKVQQLVHSITEAISTGKLKTGDTLPSINQLSNETGFSRDTIFKAYNILKRRNVVESAPTKGYYVASESYRIFMLLDDFSSFKEQLYQSFRQNLPPTYSVDLLFHHYNQEVFNQLVQNSLGRYNTYIVMNISNKDVAPILNKIDSNKLLILDMGNPKNEQYNYVVQDFNKAIRNCLKQGLLQLKKYQELVLVYSEEHTPHPEEVVQAVSKFGAENDIKIRLINRLNREDVVPGKVFFVIRDADLVSVIKYCQAQNYKIGKQIGILSYNDTPMKEIVGGGISVVSVNFEKMGQMAAQFAKNKQRVNKVLPTFLTLRNSL